MPQPSPFENSQIRSAQDKATKQYWFSVVDICAALRACDYQSARNYWKWLKGKLIANGSQLVTCIKQLQFEAQDGKLRFTDVMGVGDVLQLIQLFPSNAAEAFRLWIAGLVIDGKAVLECLVDAVLKVKDMVRRKVGGLAMVVVRRDFNVFGDVDG